MKTILIMTAVILLSCQKSYGTLNGEYRVKNAVKEYITGEEGTSEGIQEICQIYKSDTVSYESCLDALYNFDKLKDYIPQHLKSELTRTIKKVEDEKPFFIKHIVPVCMKTEECERWYVVVEDNKRVRVTRLEVEGFEDGLIHWRTLDFDILEEMSPLFDKTMAVASKILIFLKKEGYL